MPELLFSIDGPDNKPVPILKTYIQGKVVCLNQGESLIFANREMANGVINSFEQAKQIAGKGVRVNWDINGDEMRDVEGLSPDLPRKENKIKTWW